MNAIGAEIEAAQITTVKKNEKMQGEQALKLIESAAQSPSSSRLAAPPVGNFPPPQPVSVTPRPGSTIEVVA